MAKKDRVDSVNQSRRRVMTSGLAGLVSVGAGALTPAEAQSPAPQAPRAPAMTSGGRMNGPLFFDVETTLGTVRGMANTGVRIFRGIPYGADTAGKNRFMPPRDPAAWAGARNCIGYGPISPQTASGFRSDYSQRIEWDKHIGTGGMNEDCLSLNVWTPGVNDSEKRAVPVSFHGGGWATGSGNGPMYTTAVNSRCSAASWSLRSTIGWPASATPILPRSARRRSSNRPACAA